MLIIQKKLFDVLDLLVDQYNNAIHSSINMTPKEASRTEHANEVWRNFYPELGGKTLAPNCSIGDHVRITKKRKHLIKDTLKDGRKRFLQFLKFNLPFQ